ncbi:hypothetical protein GCM10009662_49660 [Catellatospora coxensis]|uniref:HTH cro/C1-type domain-containing protein n=1 Tax=Catellatospora coxensis TaxID=310354 RepID=A0A8J3P6Q9_9ACTN|nr:hypothetical protein Cco03nite_28060 [Catellatospora coxensis]
MEQAYDAAPTSPQGRADAESTGSDWAARVTRVVASQIKYWRLRRGLSAKQLSDRTDDLGFRVPRTVIANLETGRRDAVGVAEILILAAALDIPPTMLVTPIGLQEAMEVLPGIEVPPWLGRGWILGARHPDYETFSHAGWQDGRRAIALYDIHRLLVQEHRRIQDRIKRLTENDSLDGDDLGLFEDSRRGRTTLLHHAVQELAYSLDRIRQHRRLIEAEGFLLPVLPPGLSVDVRGSESTGRHHADETSATDVPPQVPASTLLPPVLFDELKSRAAGPASDSMK